MNYVAGDLRDQLSHVGHDVVQAGLVVGSGGNLSARLPGDDACWVTASGAWLDRLNRGSFVRVRVADGVRLPAAGSDGAGFDAAGSDPAAWDGRAADPTSELALHLATYRARPDVNAIVHLHPQTVLLLDAVDQRVRLVTTDHVFYLREVVRTPFRPPGGDELAAVAAGAAAGGANCIVLAHHGCSVIAESVELAHKRARNLEEAAQLTYRALAAGVLASLPECPAEFRERIADSGGLGV